MLNRMVALAMMIVDLSVKDVAARLVDLQSVYEMVYEIPTGLGTGFRSALMEHSQQEGFHLRAAIDENHRIVGFGFGFTGYPGQTWRDNLAEVAGVTIAEEWLTGHFEFAEFGVIPSMRRRGIGTQLHEALLNSLTHKRAVLTVREHNEPARKFYARQKWEVIYENFFSPTGRGPYTMMGKILKDSSG